VTAEEAARARRVSLDTVRTQVRTVLRKTNAANLRDLERILAVISA
jgi:DNA-binding NarL/FixJ family response regulator